MTRNKISRKAIDISSQENIRIDKYIADYLKIMKRSQLKTRKAEIRINHRPAKLSSHVQPGDLIEVYYDEIIASELMGEDIPLDIIFENDSVIVVNKQQGMVVHPGKGNSSGTLVHALIHHCSELDTSFQAETQRPGIVHRLDKDTSGVIIAAKNPEALEYLSNQFKKRTAKKKYIAIVKGELQRYSGTISFPIGRDPKNRKKFAHIKEGGKEALTEYRSLRHLKGYTLLQLTPKTGRTHQLRVHMSNAGNPILGDPVYSRKDKRLPNASLMLHAFLLQIQLPGEKGKRTFRAALPKRFRDIIKTIESS
jgi:23S rRNA pseudouridine1911/1915/1917 synthase